MTQDAPHGEIKNILLIFDSFLVMQAKVLIMGLRETLTGKVRVHCLVTEEVFSVEQTNFCDFANQLGVEILFYQVLPDLFVKKTAAVSNLSYHMFVLDRYLDSDCQTVLYLDIDIVPVRNFDELFELKFEHAIGAVAHDDIVSKKRSKNWKLIANCGVVYFDILSYVESNSSRVALDYFDEHSSDEGFTDEVLLNKLFWKKWYDLGTEYNTSYTKTWYSLNPFTRRKIRLVHFIGPRKPWISHKQSPLASSFLSKYKKRETEVLNTSL